MRLIDADALLEQTEALEAVASEHVVKDEPSEDLERWHRWMAILSERTGFKYDIMDAPTIEAVPVRHGHWEYEPSIYGNGFYKCSVCGKEWSHWWASVMPLDRMNYEMNYCPHCGAKMDGERRDEDDH